MPLPLGVKQLGTFQGGKGDTGSLAFATAETVPWTEPVSVQMVGPESARGAHFKIPMPLPSPATVNNDEATRSLVLTPTGTRAALDATYYTPGGMKQPASKERLASDRVYTLSRAEAIENAVFYGDFTRLEFSKRGAIQQRKAAVEGDGRVAVAASNLLSGVLPFTGYSVATNTLPLGWERHGSGGTFTLTECTSDIIGWRSVTAPGMNAVIPGIRTRDAVLLPNKTYVLAFGCEMDATVDDITRLQIARLASGTVTTIRPTLQRATEGGSRAVITFTTPPTGGPWQLVFLGNTPRALTNADMTVRLSNIMLSEFPGLVPFEYRRLAGPNYSQTATPALNTKLKVEAPVTANVIVAARTDEVGFIVRRTTVTNAGEVDLSQLIPGATFTVREVFVWRSPDDAITSSQAWAEAPRYQPGWMKAVAPAQWVAARTRDGATASLTVPESQADVARAIGSERNNGGLQSNGGPNAVAYDSNRLHHVKFDTNQLKSVVDVAGNNSSSRAEISLDPVVVAKGVSQWMGFYLQVDSTLDTPNDPKGSTIFGGAAALWQLRYRPDSGENSAFSPEASIRVIQKNKLLLAIAGDLGVPDFTSEQNTTGYVLPDGAALTTQQWEYTPGVPQWVWMRFVYDPTHGQVELFIDGVQVYRNLDIPFGYTRTNTPEVRFGAYKYASDRLVVQFYGSPIPGSADLTSLRQPGAAPPAF